MVMQAIFYNTCRGSERGLFGGDYFITLVFFVFKNLVSLRRGEIQGFAIVV
jgi:hypothetical protein